MMPSRQLGLRSQTSWQIHCKEEKLSYTNTHLCRNTKPQKHSPSNTHTLTQMWRRPRLRQWRVAEMPGSYTPKRKMEREYIIHFLCVCACVCVLCSHLSYEGVSHFQTVKAACRKPLSIACDISRDIIRVICQFTSEHMPENQLLK